MIGDLVNFNRGAQAILLGKGIDNIPQATGVAPVGYRVPLYRYTNDTIDLLIERGFEYGTSLMGDNIPHVLGSRGETLIETSALLRRSGKLHTCRGASHG
jgi:hypothetical protein